MTKCPLADVFIQDTKVEQQIQPEKKTQEQPTHTKVRKSDLYVDYDQNDDVLSSLKEQGQETLMMNNCNKPLKLVCVKRGAEEWRMRRREEDILTV